MDKYLFVQSNESNVFFIDNTTSRFRVQLKFPLSPPGVWKGALVEFHATATSKSDIKADDGLYIYTDLCTGSIVDGEERPLLRRLEKSTKSKWDYILETPYYHRVTKSEIREFEIHIKGEQEAKVSHLAKPVHLTLHLKPYPFWEK
jgi:hypothetical protein